MFSSLKLKIEKVLMASLVLTGLAPVNMAGAAGTNPQAATVFSWMEPQSKVLPNGALEWMPKAFVFENGDSVRYIDFEAGDDAKDGRTRLTAWKHHPWDANATDAAKACGDKRESNRIVHYL